jgi:hypothetical protein
MTPDEMRTQNALALLEVREAETEVARLEKERASFAHELRRFADVAERIHRGMLGTFLQDYSYLTPSAAYEILSKLEGAKGQLDRAKAKWNEQ